MLQGHRLKTGTGSFATIRTINNLILRIEHLTDNIVRYTQRVTS